MEQILKTAGNQPIDNEYMEPLDTFSSTASDGDDLPF
jgi:ATP phosphoribosyltransferase regulatory subunit HisZ